MNKHIDQLLQQRMDRKNFLKNVALGVVMMSGAATIIKTFHQPAAQPNSQQSGSLAYGASAYGGTNAAAKRQ